MKTTVIFLSIHLFLFGALMAEGKDITPTQVSMAQLKRPIQDARNGSIFHINTSSSVITKDAQISIKMSPDRIRIKRRGQSKAALASVGTNIYPKDTLITDNKTTAQIAMNDATQFNIGCLTRLTFQERFFLGQDLISVLKLWHGLVRIKITDATNQGGFTLKTTAAICRSTVPAGYVAQHFEAQELGKHGHTQITLIWGVVRIRNLINGESHLLSKPGDTIICSDTEPQNQPACLEIANLDAAALAKFLPFKLPPEPTNEDTIPIPPPIDTPQAAPTPVPTTNTDIPTPEPNDDLILDSRPAPTNPPNVIPTDENDVKPLSP